MPPESILRDFLPMLSLFFEITAAPRQIYRPMSDVDFLLLEYREISVETKWPFCDDFRPVVLQCPSEAL